MVSDQISLTRLIRALQRRADTVAASGPQWKQGQVTGVNGDGTVMVSIGADPVPVNAKTLASYVSPQAGDVVELLAQDNYAVVHGPIAGPPSLVASAAPRRPTWVPLTLATGWTGHAWFDVDPGGFVHLHGQPSHSTAPADATVITTLPSSAFYPATNWRFASVAVRAGIFVDVNTSGQILYRTATDPTPASANPSLDPCIFMPGI